ncbi:MAG: dNTP triphosphohydrolase [Donghicola eburneus]|nr:dNTP triphosphohydrolase [Donghicola eburneus]MCI5042889.1 dNTP triphosphohydrolase [Donghicola eburneus]
MDWEKLLSDGRFNAKRGKAEPTRPAYIQDYDRIVFSEPFRRLAFKTQVHPLHENDHLHHRLIHSIETSSVGRSLASKVEYWLIKEKGVHESSFGKVSGAVQAACIAHDIGNPPFGHSGEDAIGKWFEEAFQEGGIFYGWIDECDQKEFTKFEGNAQGFRILTNTEMYRGNGGMNLSFATLGAFVKYPFRAFDDKGNKYGIFRSDWNFFEELAEQLGLAKNLVGTEKLQERYARHPLVYLVEAADDISYNIVDLEDAHTSGDLSYEQVRNLLGALTGGDLAELEKQESKDRVEHVGHLRAVAIGKAIDACVACFEENYDEIMKGHYKHKDLISGSSLSKEFREIKTVCHSQLFKSPRKVSLEISGRNILRKILSAVAPIYVTLSQSGWDQEKLDGYELQVCNACGLDLRSVSNKYDALHSLADFVSGMTDRYAVKVASQF